MQEDVQFSAAALAIRLAIELEAAYQTLASVEHEPDPAEIVNAAVLPEAKLLAALADAEAPHSQTVEKSHEAPKIQFVEQAFYPPPVTDAATDAFVQHQVRTFGVEKPETLTCTMQRNQPVVQEHVTHWQDAPILVSEARYPSRSPQRQGQHQRPRFNQQQNEHQRLHEHPRKHQ